MGGDHSKRALALRWKFFEQCSRVPYIAVTSLYLAFWGHDEPRQPELITCSNVEFGVIERHPTGCDWFAGNALSLADLVLHAYTCCADEGGFDLAPVPRVSARLARVAAPEGVTRTSGAPTRLKRGLRLRFGVCTPLPSVLRQAHVDRKQKGSASLATHVGALSSRIPRSGASRTPAPCLSGCSARSQIRWKSAARQR